MNRPPVTTSTSSVINSYRKRRKQRGPNIIYIIAGALILGGIILLIVWLSGPGQPLNTLFATDTPTPTLTRTPTLTPIPSETPTITPTATETPTSTPAAPFTYTVQEGDSLAVIAERFALGDNGIPLILLLNPYNEETGTGIDPTTQIVYPGQQITIPNPGMQLPTATSIPANLPRGTLLEYVVQSGDSLAVIASLFNSTVEAIIEENELPDPNAIYVGQLLVVPANLVTPTATLGFTSTPAVTRTPTP
jgi:LysM repeat protein